ncbi:MAG: Trm112 family protein [Candidatus Altiarchaeales archaeon]|nr:Trm112 family protein [Candidatus Altiarchaeales archaeon]
MDQKLLEILACPKCKGDLELAGDSLTCSKCRLRYRIEDGIPIMLIDEAEKLEE